MTDKKIWFLTGAGHGVGIDNAKAALAAGHAVVATGRNPERVRKAIGDKENLLTIGLDITDQHAATAGGINLPDWEPERTLAAPWPSPHQGCDALAVAHLMRRQAEQASIHLSVRELLASLESIQETVLLYPSTGGRPKARRILTDHDATAAKLGTLFGVEAYAPRS